MKTRTNARTRQKGAVALEYILLAALVAIGLIGAFVYFRGEAKKSVEKIADTTTEAVDTATEDASGALEGYESSNTGGGGEE
jgi:Flp pilus assembly pilin Flp